MSLTEQGYKPRLIDRKIAQYMGLFGALSIEGPKYCGKTWTALNHANSAAPAFLCVITGGGPLYTRDDGVIVVPIDCLKP